MRTRLKVCCISSPEEAAMAVAAGADALGLVAEMPSGPGVLDDALIATIAAVVPPTVARFLLTSRTDPDAIVAHALACRVDTVQLVDAVPLAAYTTLRREAPHLRIVQVLHVEDEGVLDQAARVAPHVDALLLDSGRPSAPVRELGGTGRVHDWELSRQVVASAGRPVFLAGGLTAQNVGEAIARVRPHGLDVCSGVRSGGGLDAARLTALVRALTAADAARLPGAPEAPGDASSRRL